MTQAPHGPTAPLPVEFENNLLAHVWSNHLYPGEAPLMLLIVGRAGTGKSEQTRMLAAKHGIHAEPTNGAEYQGREGESKVRLVAAYTNAAKAMFTDKKPPFGRPTRNALLLIDDFHLSLASVLSDNFSQNSQIFMAALMTGCTSPDSLLTEAFKEDLKDQRVHIPIVATANSTNQVYPPLLRHGRVRVYHWEPSREDCMRIGHYHLSKLGRTDLSPLLEQYGSELPAFFGELANQVRERQIVHLIRSGTAPSLASVSQSIQDMELAAIEAIAAAVKTSEALRTLKFD